MTCILRVGVFPQEIIAANTYWPYVNIRLHITCKWLYNIWITHLRERALAKLIYKHTQKYCLDNVYRVLVAGTIQPVIWGDISLFPVAEYDVMASFTICGRSHDCRKCVIRYCRIYSITTSYCINTLHWRNVLSKYDIINGITYQFAVISANREWAMSQLYDCSLLPLHQPEYAIVSIYIDVPRDVDSHIGGILAYKAQLDIHMSASDKPEQSGAMIDNRYVMCKPMFHPFNDTINSHIGAHIDSFFAYMRSPDINSGRLVQTLCLDQL